MHAFPVKSKACITALALIDSTGRLEARSVGSVSNITSIPSTVNVSCMRMKDKLLPNHDKVR